MNNLVIPLSGGLRRVADGVAELFLGAACPGCGAPGLTICAACLAALSAGPPVVRRCRYADGSLPVLAAGRYEPPIDELLLAHKDRGAWHIAGRLADVLARLVQQELGDLGDVVLCPVPSDARTVRERGYDHCRTLTRLVGKRLNLEMRPLLVRTKRVGDQVGRTAKARVNAQANTMVATRSGRHSVVLIDDIVTTGATLGEAARALTAAGHRPLFGATIAATVRRLPRCGAAQRATS